MTARLPFLALAAACLLSAGPALAQASPEARFEPFALPVMGGSTVEAERGTFSVPENRAVPGSRRIDIGFVRLRALTPTPDAPIVYLAGGPGGSGVDVVRGPRHPVLQALRQVADVILLDQRGVGLSDATPICAADAPFDAAQPLTEATWTAYNRATVLHCADVWRAAGVDLGGYTTEESADDLEALRQALGVPRLNLMAISYGTHLALATVRRHPDSIDRIVLASVEGMDQTVKRPDRLDAALERLSLAAGPQPDGSSLIEVMRRVHARYAEPRPVDLTTPDGQSVTFQMDAFPIQTMTGFLAKNPSGLPRLEAFYQALDQDQVQAAVLPIAGAFLAEPLALRAMPTAMDLASGVSPARTAQIEAQAPGSLLGRATNFPMPQLAGLLPGLDLGEDYRQEVSWAGPALILSGDLDLRTPLEEQAEATAGLSGRTTVVVRNGGHDLFEAHPGVPALLVAFFSGRPVPADDLVLPAP